MEDGVHAPVIYEFDSGYVLAMPVGGGAVANGGIEDGDYFRSGIPPDWSRRRSNSTKTAA